jgi:hypothetical protein
MELRNEKDARFIIRHHVTEEKLLHLEKGVRKLGFQSGGKRIMSIFPWRHIRIIWRNSFRLQVEQKS